MKRLELKFRRYVGWLPLLLFLVPVAGFALVGLAISSGSGFGVIGGILGFLLIVITALAGVAISLAIPAAVIGVFGYLVWSYYRKSKAGSPQPAGGGQAAALVQPQAQNLAQFSGEIAMLEELRQRLAAEARRRVRLFVPPALVLGLLLAWAFTSLGNSGSRSSGSPLFVYLFMLGFAGIGSWVYAVGGPGARYALAFKHELVPRLLKAYGDLQHSIGTMPPLGSLCSYGVLPGHDQASADDVFEGTYRGHAIRISEIDLTRKNDDDDVTTFHGVLIDLAVATPFRGTTVVADKAERGGRFFSAPDGLMPVRLEDPVFDEIYGVYGSDQIEARAVLTPAVMQRLLVMSDGKSFFPPRFLIEGTRMSFALSRYHPGSLFEPPGLESQDAAAHLASLEGDLAMIFGLADAMVEMHIAVRPSTEFQQGGKR
ncbi:DUF3137 domain-containing protein [Bosea caraganae]|nr:DUF3137 domain-containing protein [Bosea caraganae]